MENKYKYILIAIAFLIAFLLYFFGIRKLSSAHLKKKSFFITSLLIALALIGCNVNSSSVNDSNTDQMNKLIGKVDSKRIKELNKTKEWKEFKIFWKNLDNVEPSKGAGINSFQSYSYAENEDYNQKYKMVDSLRKRNEELKNNLNNLVKSNLLDPLEPIYLFNICNSRIQYIYYGNTSMMTRMMPSQGLIEKEKSLVMLEFKIDTLLNLEKKGKIDTSELKLAMDNILKEVRTVSILEILDQQKMLYYYPGYLDKNENNSNDTNTIVDKTILDFNKSYKEFMKKYNASKADKSQKELYERYDTIKRELDKYIAIYPQFCELIKDLIVNV
jgi:hypothetical protein